MTPTQLDRRLTRAFTRLSSRISRSSARSKRGYSGAFDAKSADGKADEVLRLLHGRLSFNAHAQAVLSAGRPVFVSIGGGDGRELIHLLSKSSSEVGFLVEFDRLRANQARTGANRLPPGKKIEVIEGDAKIETQTAMAAAFEAVHDGKGERVVVSCHAIIHELFDRGVDGFDPRVMFGQIFGDPSVPTLFTYREPGKPSEWPDTVIVSADCDPANLLKLARLICEYHPPFRKAFPQPTILGEGVMMSGELAMELLVKLFYLRTLETELQERSTSVNHARMAHVLGMAIGQQARAEGAGQVFSLSGPTSSFRRYWERYHVQVSCEDELRNLLIQPIPESQTRLVAWRVPRTSMEERNLEAEIKLASDALATSDTALLTKLLLSRGRAWIEFPGKAPTVKLLRAVRARSGADELLHVWAHYLISVDRRLAEARVSPELFSKEWEDRAQKVGLGLLFRAQRMEFLRETTRLGEAVSIANNLLREFRSTPDPSGVVETYSIAVSRFLLANLFRQFGLYQDALGQIQSATRIFIRGTASHEAELAHCYYAQLVCGSMLGKERSGLPPVVLPLVGGIDFAEGFIKFGDSLAAWALQDTAEAYENAVAAVRSFTRIPSRKYADRALHLAKLLGWWESVRTGKPLALSKEDRKWAGVVLTLTEEERDIDQLQRLISTERPSRVLGMLQFAHGRRRYTEPIALTTRELYVMRNGELTTVPAQHVNSVRELDSSLRSALGIPLTLRVPLLSD